MERPSRSRMFREFMKTKRNTIPTNKVTLSEKKGIKLIKSAVEKK